VLRKRQEAGMTEQIRLATDEELAMHPTCAVCRKPVEVFRRWQGMLGTVYECRCHGEVELTTISDLDLARGPITITGAEAFATRRLADYSS
jgi:hypothetical protein